MALSAPTYNAGAGVITLPDLTRFRQTYRRWGSSTVLADGSIATDIVNALGDIRMNLEWTVLDNSEHTVVRTFYDAAYGVAVTFVDPGGVSASMEIEPQTPMDESWYIDGSGTARVDIPIRLVSSV